MDCRFRDNRYDKTPESPEALELNGSFSLKWGRGTHYSFGFLLPLQAHPARQILFFQRKAHLVIRRRRQFLQVFKQSQGIEDHCIVTQRKEAVSGQRSGV